MQNATKLAHLPRKEETTDTDSLPIPLQERVAQWFKPREETQMVAASQTKGIFLPYPLLGILVTLGALALSGIIALEVQVSNLNTTILLRDADQRASNQLQSDKLATLEVYLHNDRERIIKLEAEKDAANKRR